MICEKSVKYFCKDFTKIENYEKAVNDQDVWDCHHRLETHTSDGEKRLVELSRDELIALGMYCNRPPDELIFIRHTEHTRLHKIGKKFGPLSEEAKRKISNGNKGKTSNKGQHWKLVNGKRVYFVM